MSDRAFVDSNILVYAHDRGAGPRHEAARSLIEKLWRERSGVLSTQVIQEFYINVRRKALNPIEPAEAVRLVEDYLRWHVVVNDGRTILGALDIEQRYSISFWDALIIEAAKTAAVSVLYSEDLSHGHRYDRVEVVSPFAR
jgi:predicted nucleic acid-binding protein